MASLAVGVGLPYSILQFTVRLAILLRNQTSTVVSSARVAYVATGLDCEGLLLTMSRNIWIWRIVRFALNTPRLRLLAML